MTLPLPALPRFGGTPLFADRVRPIGQLTAPPLDVFFSLVRPMPAGTGWPEGSHVPQIAEAAPDVVQQLEAALADLHETRHVIACANACVGLVALAELLGRPHENDPAEVILPSFTYAGLPHLVQWSGHLPRFCDAAESTHALCPEAVRAAINDRTAMILGVHQVNSPCAIDELEAISAETGVPLIFDAVHGLYNTHKGRPIGNFGRAEVFSLHATKILNGFEGGYITTNEDALATKLRRFLHEGELPGDPLPQMGMNGRLPPVHAAFALAGVPEIPAACERNRQRYLRYRQGVASIPGLSIFAYPDNNERFNYEFSILEVGPAFGCSRDTLVELLLEDNTRARAYYGPAVHETAHRPPEVPRPSLPVTEAIAQRFVQLPVGEHVSLDDIDKICMRFAQIHALRDQLNHPPSAGNIA